MKYTDTNYQVALMMESGEWDVIDEFYAESDEAANEYAESHYAGQEWYVLNKDGENING
jgi:hypothetical protein